MREDHRFDSNSPWSPRIQRQGIFMAYFVYIIYSTERNRYYIGQTENVQQRVQMHRIRKNLGASDWQLKHAEEFSSRSEAMKREAAIKARKSRAYIESLFMPSG